MENVVLTIHLILAVLLTGIVLMQRSEGGGLGVGGGSGGGVMSGRQAANAMTRLTWIFGIALFVTSLSLTIIAARNTSNSSIMDQIGAPASQQSDSNTPDLPTYTPPPSSEGNPLTPPAPDAAAPAAAPEEAATETQPATNAAPEAEANTATPAEAVTPPAPATEEPAAAENGAAATDDQTQSPN